MARSARKMVAALVVAIPVAILANAAHASLVIGEGPTANVTCVAQVCTATADNAVLSISKLETMLAKSDVKVVAESSAQDIEVDKAFTWISANTLTLDSYRSITINEPVSVAGSGGVTLTTNDGGTGGALLFYGKGNINFLSTSNHLVIDGKTYKLESSVKGLAYDIVKQPKGKFALARSYDASIDGIYTNPPIPVSFGGIFNGLGNTISGVEIVDNNSYLIGLFTELQVGGVISSVSIVKLTIISGGNRQINNLGGLVAINRGVVINARASGSVIHGDAGVLVGENYGTISKCSANGFASGEFAGGLVASNFGLILQSFASANVKGRFAGGLAGSNATFGISGIVDSYATGNVRSVGRGRSYVGGLTGNAYSSSSVSTSFSTGAVTLSSTGFAGGFLGLSLGTNQNSYWDTTTSGITDLSKGAGNPSNAPGIAGLTTVQLQSGLPAGFDPSIWGENPSINGGLPYLLANPPPG